MLWKRQHSNIQLWWCFTTWFPLNHECCSYCLPPYISSNKCCITWCFTGFFSIWRKTAPSNWGRTFLSVILIQGINISFAIIGHYSNLISVMTVRHCSTMLTGCQSVMCLSQTWLQQRAVLRQSYFIQQLPLTWCYYSSPYWVLQVCLHCLDNHSL